MICERCRRRFGKPGENFWAAHHDVCPACKEIIHTHSTPMPSDKEKKLG